jgi:hypothetical protein
VSAAAPPPEDGRILGLSVRTFINVLDERENVRLERGREKHKKK